MHRPQRGLGRRADEEGQRKGRQHWPQENQEAPTVIEAEGDRTLASFLHLPNLIMKQHVTGFMEVFMMPYWKVVGDAGQGNLVALLLLSLCTKIKVKAWVESQQHFVAQGWTADADWPPHTYTCLQ